MSRANWWMNLRSRRLPLNSLISGLFAGVLITAPAAAIAASGGLKASPPRINFGKVVFGAIGATSAQKTVKITDPKNGQPIGGLTVQLRGTDPGDFNLTNGCGATLQPGAECGATLTFTPTALGLRSGILIIGDSVSSNAASVALAGTGVQGKIMIKPNSVSFGKVNVDTISSAQTVTLTNPNSVALNVGPFTVTGPFAQKHNCGAQLTGNNGTCDIMVTFNPVSAANPKGSTETGGLSISDNAVKSPQIVRLKGIAFGTPIASPTPTATPTSTMNATPTSTPIPTATGSAGSPTPTGTGTPTATPAPGNAAAPAFVPLLQ